MVQVYKVRMKCLFSKLMRCFITSHISVARNPDKSYTDNCLIVIAVSATKLEVVLGEHSALSVA